jgi:hypothetical protein
MRSASSAWATEDATPTSGAVVSPSRVHDGVQLAVAEA